MPVDGEKAIINFQLFDQPTNELKFEYTFEDGT